MSTTYRHRIRSVARDRQVHFLFHFTPMANLPALVKRGLMSRRRLEECGYAANYSAKFRLDENEDAISVSVSRPNGSLLSLKRKGCGHQDWVILALSSEILWTHSCRFFWCNGAKKKIKDHRGWLGGPWAFSEMFAGSSEERRGLKECEPTFQEAEVQVLDDIASKYICGAIVDRLELVAPVQSILSGLPNEPRKVIVGNMG